MGGKTFPTLLPAAHSPISNNAFTEKRAEDSMNMVAMILYNLLVSDGDPVAVRSVLPCRTSRVTIIRVRRMLSETEIDRCRRAKSTGIPTREPPHPRA